MNLYGLWGEHTSSWLTCDGLVIAHTDRSELEFLCPGTSVKPLNGIDRSEVLMIRDHPDMGAVQWPLKRSDFRG